MLLSLVHCNSKCICITDLILLQKKAFRYIYIQNTMMQESEFWKHGIVPGFCKSGQIYAWQSTKCTYVCLRWVCSCGTCLVCHKCLIAWVCTTKPHKQRRYCSFTCVYYNLLQFIHLCTITCYCMCTPVPTYVYNWSVSYLFIRL